MEETNALIEPTLINPIFVTHPPKQLIPLANLSPDAPDTVEVFECCFHGQEIAPAYTEQYDPVEQRERLCMLLLGQESIRDVIRFPQLRPLPSPVGH